MKRLILGSAALALLLCGVGQLKADSMAFSTGNTTGNQTWGGNMGLDFNVTSPIKVTALGAYDSGQDGFVGTIGVGLYQRLPGSTDPSGDHSGTLLATVAMTGTAGNLVGNYRFMSLSSPLVLAPGAYSIVATGFSAADPNGNETITSPAGFSVGTNSGGGLINAVGSGRFDSNPALDYPVNTSLQQGFGTAGPHVFGAGNFEFNAAPEPSSLTLVGLGAAGAFGYVLRRRQKTTVVVG